MVTMKRYFEITKNGEDTCDICRQRKIKGIVLSCQECECRVFICSECEDFIHGEVQKKLKKD